MKLMALGFLTLAVFAQYARPAWNFDHDSSGRIASGFTSGGGEWIVVSDSTAPSPPNVLAQNAKRFSSEFNVILSDAPAVKDLDLSVSFKSIAGSIDQGGGLVWRAADASNYYMARYSPLENNHRIYKVVRGARTQLGTATIAATPGWHTLRVTMSGDHIECFYDGVKYTDLHDSTYTRAGKIGLWTKSDAQTRFDDLRVRDR